MCQDIIQGLKNKKIQMVLPSHLWTEIDSTILSIVKNGKWKTFKFYQGDHEHSSEINKISNETGGIYVFYVSPEVIPQNHRIIMYVGESHYTQHQNLRKRINEYYGYAPPDLRRPKISNMIGEWWDYLYCGYLELECENEEILKIESELIDKFLFPCNDKIPDIVISQAVKAAGLQ